MKCVHVILASALFGSTELASAQGFVNLDFENPVSPLTPVGFQVPASNAIPGWTAYVGGNQVNQVFYDTVSLGSAAVSVHDSASLFPPIQGQYSVILQTPSAGLQTSSAIAQSGQIPLGAQSLIFDGTTAMKVTFNGTPIPLVQIGSGVNYSIVGGNISAFAGQTGQLEFALPQLSFDAMTYLDNIQFSSSAVPEPSEFRFVMLGALSLGLWRLRKSAR